MYYLRGTIVEKIIEVLTSVSSWLMTGMFLIYSTNDFVGHTFFHERVTFKMQWMLCLKMYIVTVKMGGGMKWTKRHGYLLL